MVPSREPTHLRWIRKDSALRTPTLKPDTTYRNAQCANTARAQGNMPHAMGVHTNVATLLKWCALN